MRLEAIEDFRRDLNFAMRALRRRLGFAAVVVLTLVIGLTSATTMFGVVYGVLWAPLPYPDADRIVTVWQTTKGTRGAASMPNFLDWRERSHAFTAIAAAEPFGVRYAAPEGPERFPAWRVTQGFFDVLRVKPMLGRTFTPDEFQRGRENVVILDYDTWRNRFNGDSSLVGKTLPLDGLSVPVVGVMPPGVHIPPRPGVWLPKVPTPDELLLRQAAYFNVVGRLAPGVTLQRARDEMRRVSAALAQEYPAVDGDVNATLVPLRENLVGSVRGRLLMLFASVGLLLLLTAANLTTLLLARAVEREGELSIRAALGAGRARLARQVFAEHFVLAALGWGLSIGLTLFALKGVRALGAGMLPLTDKVHVGVPAVLFAGITALASVIAPASPGRRHGRRFQQLLVVSEVALALVLVFGAGLFVRSFRALLGVDPGFSSTNVLAVTLQTESLYQSDSSRATFVRTVADRLATIPGVEHSGLTTALPFAGAIGPEQASYEVVGSPVGSKQALPTVHTAAISPGYFEALHIPLRTGRFFVATDDRTHPHVAIVSAAFARQCCGNGDPIGQRLELTFAGDPTIYQIIGVVGDIHDVGLDQPPLPVLYLPYQQAPTGGVTFVLQTGTAPRAMLSRVRGELAAVNASQPIASITTLDELLGASTRGPRLVLTILGLFASIALALAGVGIFGVMSHLTRTRTREVSIRLALGATARGIRRLILGEAIALAGMGSGIGLIIALISARSVRALLYAVSPVDPMILGAVIVLLLAVTTLAAYIPARRAGSVDAVRALRES